MNVFGGHPKLVAAGQRAAQRGVGTAAAAPARTAATRLAKDGAGPPPGASCTGRAPRPARSPPPPSASRRSSGLPHTRPQARVTGLDPRDGELVVGDRVVVPVRLPVVVVRPAAPRLGRALGANVAATTASQPARAESEAAGTAAGPERGEPCVDGAGGRPPSRPARRPAAAAIRLSTRCSRIRRHRGRPRAPARPGLGWTRKDVSPGNAANVR